MRLTAFLEYAPHLVFVLQLRNVSRLHAVRRVLSLEIVRPEHVQKHLCDLGPLVERSVLSLYAFSLFIQFADHPLSDRHLMLAEGEVLFHPVHYDKLLEHLRVNSPLPVQ